jgi:hypothetical protein
VVTPVAKTRAPAKKRAPAKGVESLVSIAEVPKEEIVVANVELEYDSDAPTIKLPESESDANLEYDDVKINVTRIVIRGVAYLYDNENLNAYHEGTKTFVGKYEPELGEISMLEMESVSELGDSDDDECPALSV